MLPYFVHSSKRLGFQGVPKPKYFTEIHPIEFEYKFSTLGGASGVTGRVRTEEHTRAELKTNGGNLATSVINKLLMRARLKVS